MRINKFILSLSLCLSPGIAFANNFTEGKPVNAENCFSAQGLDLQTSRNIVEIVAKTSSGIVTGTGSIVSDSGDASNPYNRIITARHVVADASEIGVIASDGQFIGTFIPLSKSTTGLSDDNGTIAITNDLAVLESQWFDSEGQKRYLSLTGLKISKYQSPHIMHGHFSIPAGIEHGASGAPMLNINNEIIGIVTQKSSPIGGMLSSVQGYNQRWNPSTNSYQIITQKINLPKAAIAWIDSLYSDDVTFALGMSGVGLTSKYIDEDVSVPGFPNRVCVLYKGHATTK